MVNTFWIVAPPLLGGDQGGAKRLRWVVLEPISYQFPRGQQIYLLILLMLLLLLSILGHSVSLRTRQGTSEKRREKEAANRKTRERLGGFLFWNG